MESDAHTSCLGLVSISSIKVKQAWLRLLLCCVSARNWEVFWALRASWQHGFAEWALSPAAAKIVVQTVFQKWAVTEPCAMVVFGTCCSKTSSSSPALSVLKADMAQAGKPGKCTNLGFLTFLGGHGIGGAAPNHLKTLMFANVEYLR